MKIVGEYSRDDGDIAFCFLPDIEPNAHKHVGKDDNYERDYSNGI